MSWPYGIKRLLQDLAGGMRTFSDAFVIRDPEAERVDGHTAGP